MKDVGMEGGITVDFLILADAAQVQGDKLYLLGGGWSLIWAKDFPVQHQLAVAAAILVPWMDTNHKHQFRIRLRGEDGASFADVGGEFEQGRPPGLPPGSTQRVLISMNMAIKLEKPVEAVAELWLDEALAKAVPFRVVRRPSR
jgi:hypothetical protein